MKKVILITILVSVVAALGFQVQKGVFVSPVTKHEPTPMELFLAPTDFVIDQNFDASTSVPTGWTVIDADADGVEWQVYPSSSGAIPHSEPNCIASNYNADGNDDWLITPLITVGADYVLDFWYAAHSADWPDDIEVRVSTGGPVPADFTDLIFTELGIPTTWQRQTLSLAAYEGGDIYIAFRNISVDQWLLKIDDVKIGSLPANDIVLSVASPIIRVMPPATFTPRVTILNEGADDATPTVYCEIYHGTDTVYSEFADLTTLTSGSSRIVPFAAFSAAGNNVYSVKFWVDPTGDATPANNTATQALTSYNTTRRKPLLQKFTSVGCGYCPRAAVGCDMVKDALGDSVVIVSYHSTTSFGSDPFYLSDAGPLASYYGVSGYPTVVFNGMYMIAGGYPGPDYGYTPYMSLIDSVTSLYTAYTVDIEVTDVTPVNCSFTATATRTAQIPTSAMPVLRYAVVEDDIAYTWGSSPTLYTIEHCVRNIPGGSSGVSLTGAAVETDSKTFTIPAAWNVDNMHIVAYVQDDYTGEIYNTYEVPVEVTSVEDRTNLPVELSISASPNPFNAVVKLDITAPDGNTVVQLLDINGRVVQSMKVSSGNNSILWDATDSRGNSLPSGVYLVRAMGGNNIVTERVILLK
jgi:hypothetical protein